MLYVARSSCILHVGVIGINFKTADLSLREAIARGAQSLTDERGLFFRHPVVPLFTCNRTEIYFSAAELGGAHSDLLALLRAKIDCPFEHRLYSYFGIECFAHLCRVAAGLDSAILAETEILRQVKVAYSKSQELFRLPGSLHYIFQKALKVGKVVRSELELKRGAPSLYGTLWQIGQDVLGNFQNLRILLVGYSEINRGLASFLLHKKIEGFSLCTKNPAQVSLSQVSIVGRDVLARWQEYDLIVSASYAEDYLIEGHSTARHLIFDLSVPRNVNPEVGKAPNTLLYNIEQVDQIIVQKRGAQNHCLKKCESLIREHVVRLASIYRQKNSHLFFPDIEASVPQLTLRN
ncbi:MAG: hypothetical protein V4487_04475 [Chlamydiota bacterium]